MVCPHMAPVSALTSTTRVLLSGTPVVLSTDQCLIAGCIFQNPVPKPSPCLQVRWLTAATRVLVEGRPPLLQSSVGLGISAEQVPQGPVSILSLQTRVTGS